jgi:hypothetical protein
MALLFCARDFWEDRTMNARGFGFEPAPPPAEAERTVDPDGRTPMRAAPDAAEGDDQRGDEPADEPGYGHGV